MNSFSPTVQIVSIVSILVPICIGIMNLKTAGTGIRLFIVFLIAGLITDITMFYLVRAQRFEHLLTIFNVYSLLEAVFFYWFTLRNITSRTIRVITKTLLFITPLFWLCFVILDPSLLFTEETSSQVFDTIYEIAIAFLAGFALLKMVEKHAAVIASPDFWIVLGIFFYCFCTFFIMSFLNTILSQEIWFLNNIINILTYIFYSIGVWKCRSDQASHILPGSNQFLF